MIIEHKYANKCVFVLLYKWLATIRIISSIIMGLISGCGSNTATVKEESTKITGVDIEGTDNTASEGSKEDTDKQDVTDNDTKAEDSERIDILN